METMQFLHMNKGEREASYAKNCTVQRQIISFGKTILEEAVAESVQNTLPNTTMGIADLGCSSGPNTLMVVSQIITHVRDTCRQIGLPLPELRVSLNDLPGNDFNYVFKLLPEFLNEIQRDKGIASDRCFVSAVAASFYGRLFPTNTLHFVHSSSSLHWLSQVPLGLVKKGSSIDIVNKGKIYISKTSDERVVKAYLSQFEKDFVVFLRCRAPEMVAGGKMVLSFMGRTSPDAAAEVGSHQWELLAQAFMAMAKEGVVQEEKIDSFNAPYYAPSPQEVRNVIDEEGSFFVNRLEAFEIGWDGGCVDDNNGIGFEETSKGQQVAKTIRAVVEPMLESQFGTEIMDELFRRYGELVGDYFSKTVAKHINLVISLTKRF